MNEQAPIARLIGNVIGNYRIETLENQNRWGGVFIARHEASDKLYRLRILDLLTALTPEARIVYLGHFQRQTRELAQLLTNNELQPKHPHLLPLVDFGNAQGQLYLVSPYVQMRTLTALQDEHGTMDLLTISLYLDQIASALEYAHQHAILHRDLTTDEVFIRADGRLVIADLGVMHLIELNHQRKQLSTLYGQSASSAPAPEQLFGQPAHTYTDVYAMGVMLYYLLTGHRVFSSKTREGLAEQHLKAPVPSLTKWRQITVGRADVTAALDRLIASAMAKDPQYRIQHPAELANYFHQIVAPNDVTRQPIASPLAATVAALRSAPVPTSRNMPASLSSAQQRVKARRRTLTFIGGTALAAVGIGAYFVGRKLTSSLIDSNNTGTIANNGNTQPTTDPNNTAATSTPGTTKSTATAGSTQPTATPAGNVIAHTSSIATNSAITFNNPGGLQAGVLVHLSNGHFVAFDSACTHRTSCAVEYVSADNLLECPCHGAAFDPANQGSVVQGPARSPLTSIQITVHADGTITRP